MRLIFSDLRRIMMNFNKRRWGRHFPDEEIASALRNNRLLTMEIETSHVCNLNCIYCYNNSGRKLPDELTYSEIIDVINQGIDLGVRRIIIIGGGEPLLHPDVMRIIDYLCEQGVGIDLFTNGTLIDKNMARRLYERGVEPVVKLNSLRAGVQDYLADKKGTFERIQEGIHNLLDAGYPDEGRDLGVESVICAQNYGDMPAMWRWARGRRIIPYFEMITLQGRARERKELNVPVRDLEKLFSELSRIDREEYGYEWEPHPPIAALNCSRHEYSCTITADGYVQPCTGVDIKVGNIRRASLREILETSPVVHCLRNIRENINGDCKSCSLLNECYGCRGMAYHLTGDFLASDPLCWRNSKHII